MKIAFCNRLTWDTPLGGDGIQMLKTKEALEKIYGLEIDIVTNPEELSNKYNLIHIFNFSTTEITRAFFEKAISLKIPIASSSIIWDYNYGHNIGYLLYFQNRYYKWSEFFIRFLYKHTNFIFLLIGKKNLLSKKFQKDIVFFIKNSNVILPNSKQEARIILDYVNIPEEEQSKIFVVTNGIDLNNKNAINLTKEEFFIKYKIPQNYILQVGRLEATKNQYSLVYALRNHPDIPIVFLGKDVYPNSIYSKKLKKLSSKRGNVYFIDCVENCLIHNFYKNAILHVLLSLRDTTGLVNIEALYNNCPVVLSSKERIPIDDYFSTQPYIVNPLDMKEVEKIVLKAYSERTIGNIDFNDISWEKAAKQTFTAYEYIFSNKTLKR